MYAGVLLDIGGVLYEGKQPVPGAVQALGRLREAGLPLRFVTNTSRATREQVADKLCRLGFEVSAGEIYTAPNAAADACRERGLHPMLVIHPALEPDLAGMDDATPDAVLVGDAGEYFTYPRLNAAFRLLLEGAPLLALARNRYFRDDDGLALDMGPFVAALEYAAGVEAEIFGKPSAAFFREAVRSLGVPAGQVLMVGDDVQSDVCGAVEAGLHGVLVRTGKFRDGDEAALPGGAQVADDFAAVVDRVIADAGA